MQNAGLSLDSESASYSYNYFAKQGNVRSVECPKSLTQEEADCYWQNYPKTANAMYNQGMDLTLDSANFSYNYFLKRGTNRDLTCYTKKDLTQDEAVCYWKNYPDAARTMWNAGVSLDQSSASFSYNYFGKKGDIRDLTCHEDKDSESDSDDERQLTDIEADCYWNNYPSAAASMA